MAKVSSMRSSSRSSFKSTPYKSSSSKKTTSTSSKPYKSQQTTKKVYTNTTVNKEVRTNNNYVTRNIETHHYNDSGSRGGLGWWDYMMLNSMMNSNRNAQQTPVVVVSGEGKENVTVVEQPRQVREYDNSGHMMGSLLAVLVGVLIVYGLFKLFARD